MRGLPGKPVVVAGGATGIGAETSRRLAHEGAYVLVGDINIAGAEATAKGIRDAGGVAEPFRFDISVEADCEALIAAAVERWGTIGALFNCAADLSQQNLGRDSDAVDVPMEVWWRTLTVNLTGYLFTIRHAVPRMLENEAGSIVNMTSGVVQGLPRFVAYGSAKSGVIALTRHVAERWGREGVRCNAVDPGITLTENQLEMVSDEERAVVLQAARSDRFGEPDEQAAVVSFLLSDEARWVNGQTWVSASSHGAP